MFEGMDMNALLAQAQQMQEQMLAARDSLAHQEFEAASGGDLVKVKVNGLGDLVDDRTELCANRQMDVAAAEKILLDNGFRMIYTPDNRNLSWSYYKEGMAAVRISFFDDIRPITNKKACIRQIRISIGKE